jgi:nucleoside-diphosphate-sugar epimerase
MSRVDAVVTGGAGFVGSHLCRSLLDAGLSVLCVDNLLTGSDRNIASLRDRSGFEFLQRDASEGLDTDLHASFIYHLASPASVPDYLSHPLETLRVNSVGTHAMLELARRSEGKLLYASTSEIYGDPLVHPQRETYWGNVNSVGIRACYDEGKRFGEALTMQYARGEGVDARIVRIFNTYGPHSRPDDGRIIPNFVTQAMKREPITIYGDGTQTRSFCYVDDLVRGLVSAMTAKNTTGEVFNLGNPRELTVREVADAIARQLGSDAGIVFRPLPQDDPSRRQPDITKARSHLGWEPAVPFDEGIDATARWFRQLLELTPSR